MKTPKLIPARSLGIGYFIQEQMEYRGWDLNKLSDNMNIKLSELTSLLENNKLLTVETAKAFADVFGSSYQYWINLDSNYKKMIARTVD
jgi:plasmid maintenance system antidote protein VapI